MAYIPTQPDVGLEIAVERAMADPKLAELPWFKALDLPEPKYIGEIVERANAQALSKDDPILRVPRIERAYTMCNLVNYVQSKNPSLSGAELRKAVVSAASARMVASPLMQATETVRGTKRPAEEEPADSSPRPQVNTGLQRRLEDLRKTLRTPVQGPPAKRRNIRGPAEAITSTVQDRPELQLGARTATEAISRGGLAVPEKELFKRARKILELSTLESHAKRILKYVRGTPLLTTPAARIEVICKIAEAIYPPGFHDPSELGMLVLAGVMPPENLAREVDDRFGFDFNDPNAWKFRDMSFSQGRASRAAMFDRARRLKSAVLSESDYDWVAEMQTWIRKSPDLLNHTPWYKRTGRDGRDMYYASNDAVDHIIYKNVPLTYLFHEIPFDKNPNRKALVDIPTIIEANGIVTDKLAVKRAPMNRVAAGKYIAREFSMPLPAAKVNALKQQVNEDRKNKLAKGDVSSGFVGASMPILETEDAPMPRTEAPKFIAPPIEAPTPRVEAPIIEAPIEGVPLRKRTSPRHARSGWTSRPAVVTGSGHVPTESAAREAEEDVRGTSVIPPVVRMANEPVMPQREVTTLDLDDLLFSNKLIEEVPAIPSDDDVLDALKDAVIGLKMVPTNPEPADIDRAVNSVVTKLSPTFIEEGFASDDTASWFGALGVKLPEEVARNEKLLTMKILKIIGTNMRGRGTVAEKASRYLLARVAYKLRDFYGIGYQEGELAPSYLKRDKGKLRASAKRMLPVEHDLISLEPNVFDEVYKNYQSELERTHMILQMYKDELDAIAPSPGERPPARGAFNELQRKYVSAYERHNRVIREILPQIRKVLFDEAAKRSRETRKATVAFRTLDGKLGASKYQPTIFEIMEGVPETVIGVSVVFPEPGTLDGELHLTPVHKFNTQIPIIGN